MQVELLSDKYKVHILTNKNVDEIYDLLSKNILYYELKLPTPYGVLNLEKSIL